MESFQPPSDYPFVIHNKINDWEIMRFNKNDWLREFNGQLLKFRQGDKSYRENPYWERLSEEKIMSLNEFFEISSVEQNKWLYFDYKYMKEVLSSNSKIFESFRWSNLGLVGIPEQDSTVWIGNEGAHTPCHMDTYGCNYVAQVFGRKRWILMPPEEMENLNPVRVPYEESSIYSSWNFYTPNNNLLRVKQAFSVVLHPGEVLFVPRHWWHYVENLDVAISINIWVPLEIDHESRMEEALVQHYISSICQDLTEEEANGLLNPNEQNLLREPCSLELIEECLKNCRKYRRNQVKSTSSTELRTKYELEDKLKLIEKFNFKSYIEGKSKLLNYNPDNCKKAQVNHSLAANLINAYCCPKNVKLVKESLLKQYEDVSL